MTHRLNFFGRCIFLFLLFCCACNNREKRKVQRSFYYWKTVFNLSSTEAKALSKLSGSNLYVKFFDVDWNEASGKAEPVAKAVFQQKPPAGVAITPVIFITQEPLQKLDNEGLKRLAINISSLLSKMMENNSLSLSNEVQLDCDWTATTRNKYFFLINHLKQQAFFKNKTVSATIRLHQLKFVSQSGVPPVNKGLLMCYNMGNLRYPQTKNSIIEEDELKKYTANLKNYQLPLDVALPIFDWWILFEGTTYKGLVRELNVKEWNSQSQIHFSTDTMVNGISFKKGQWLRHETSNAETVKNCAEHISKNLKAKELTLILYHLDSTNLSKYSQHELESFYNSFR